MWVLECDGDLFAGKKKWLKPGQKYLFGRTKVDAKPDEQFHTINNKSVSRKHLVIAVGPVARGQGNRLYEKSEVTLTDESKLGTHLNGEKFLNESRTLSGKTQTIRLGSFEQVFRISWQPVVFTFSYTLKEQQRQNDILAPLRQKLEPLDIKTILTYSIIDTTHVVASKRNIPKTLQALVNAKYIVKEHFIDAVLGVCASAGLADDGVTQLPSPLEDDFESNWPDAGSFLPDPGKEPVLRPAERFAPNTERISLFEGFTFVFADESQYEQLSAVVTNGGAKALKYDLKLGETKLGDFVQYIRSVADQKGIKDLAQGDAARKVVVVRFRGKGSTEQWALDFVQSLDLELGQRSIEQNEFLDAILMNDPSALHRPLEEDGVENFQKSKSPGPLERDGPAGNPNGSRNVEEQREEAELEDNTAGAPSQKAETKEPPGRSRFRRPITESRFKGFDDFDPSQLPKVNKNRVVDEEEVNEREQDRSHQSDMDVDSQSLFIPESQPGRSSRKRQPQEENADEDMFESLLPAAAAMKRRRLEDKRAGRVAPIPENPAEASQQQNQADKTAAPKKKKEIDIRTEARSHAEKLDRERSQRRSESRDDGNSNGHAHDEDISQLRNLALVEDMPIQPRNRPVRGDGTCNTQGATNSRWDDRWNGLKNFKKFKRHADRSEPAANRGTRVLVALEEVKRKDFGIGENYWLEPSTSSKRDKRNRQARDHTQTQTQTEQISDGGVEDAEQEEELLLEEVAGQPRKGPVADALAEQARPSRPANRTRSAAAARAPPPKRTRQTRAAAQARDEESSDEDELKFRLKRRRG